MGDAAYSNSEPGQLLETPWEEQRATWFRLEAPWKLGSQSMCAFTADLVSTLMPLQFPPVLDLRGQDEE